MAGKRHSRSEIEDMLKEAAELQTGGKRIADVADTLGISKQTLFRWRRKYGTDVDGLAVPRRTTRKTILDTAERLLAEEGMAVSLRRIMSEARVNIAAIHYHFGDRQALIDALVDRRLGTVNGARLKRLAEARQRSDPARLEDIVQAFMGPSVEASLSADSGWQHFSRFLVWLVNDPQTTSRTLLKNVYGELHPRFQAAFRNRLPHLSATDFHWRYHSMIAVMAAAVHNRDRLIRLSAGDCGSEGFSATMAALTPIAIAIWTAPPSSVGVEHVAVGIESLDAAVFARKMNA